MSAVGFAAPREEDLRWALMPGFIPRRARDLRAHERQARAEGRLAHLPGLELRADASLLESCLGRLRDLQAEFLTDADPRFPVELREIPDPPIHLFVRGSDCWRSEQPRVAIIGARAASEAGREIAYSLARDLALRGIVVISGLARGIDGEAHRGALEAGGQTVAVLGAGLDVCYPPEHRDLFAQIPGCGALVTEFPPGTPPLGRNFPMRNRILSGLADLLVVVEGNERSGARSTVDHALDQGKEVWAVPRDICLPGCALPNRLLNDGARPVLSSGELERAAREVPRIRFGSVPLAPGERLLRLLRNRSRTPEQLLNECSDLDPAVAQVALLALELDGQVSRLPNGRLASVLP
ncbi:MAG: DNA-protecting protein DprA [Candidatus Eisenbacteria bacterium]|nr:DNA-protecting protein DprA [Candidatus Eisenbacteria bacterium]MCC7143912.1 DNA-protecting protein DprA [Candidatus Eisenbacteria bacterium]